MSNMVGELVSLRPIEKKDLEVLNRWKNKEEVYMFLGGGYHPISPDQQEKWLDSMIDQTGSNRRFMIIVNDRAVGMVGLYDINWIHRTCEIGSFIGDTAARGKGYASEACTLLEQYAGNYLNLRKINLKVVTDNKKGVAMWSKLGYTIAGKLKQERYIKGQYRDLTLMEKFIEKTGGGYECLCLIYNLYECGGMA